MATHFQRYGPRMIVRPTPPFLIHHLLCFLTITPSPCDGVEIGSDPVKRINLLLAVLIVMFGAAANRTEARSDCIAECDSAIFCDGEMHVSGECARQRGQCYIKECSRPTRSYGALAYGTKGTSWGYSFDQPSTVAAERRALADCATYANDCKVVASFSNSCGAIAAGTNKRASVAQANTDDRARTNALSACKSNGGDKCEVRVWMFVSVRAC